MQELSFLLTGLLLGLVAGISPGPLLTLVISETVKYNKKAGIKVACAPLITDIPIVLLSVFLLYNFKDNKVILSSLSFLGALFLIYLAYENFKNYTINIQTNSKEFSLQKGIIANFLSPHPYFFWITVGGPILFKSYKLNIFSSTLFIAGFYFALITSKIIISLLTDKTKNFINKNSYSTIIKLLGIVLIIFAIIFVTEGIKYLN